MPDPNQKIHPLLDQIPLPQWAIPTKGMVNVIATLYPGVNLVSTIAVFEAKGFSILHQNEFGNTISLSISDDALVELASLPFVQFIEAVDPPSQAENYTGRTTAPCKYAKSGISWRPNLRWYRRKCDVTG